MEAEHEAFKWAIIAALERAERRMVMWTASVAIAVIGLAFIAGLLL